MKDNKEFIQGIYQKYDEYQNEQKIKKLKYKRYIPIISLATMVVIAFSITNIYIKNQIKIEEPYNEVEQIGLEKIETFEKFYTILKKQESEDADTTKRATVQDKLESITQNENEETYSQTNTQVVGVDEADIIKTDGKYIYYVSDKKVVIIDIQNSGSSKKVAEIPFEDNSISIREIYLKNDKLVVIASENEIKTELTSIYQTEDVAYVDGITIKTEAIIYNVSNPEKPQEERRVEIEGTYISSRMIENNIYFASSKYISNAINMIKKYPIEELNEDDYKPVYVDTIISEENKHINFNEIQYFDESEVKNYLIVAGFNINEKEEADVQAFLGAGDTIYASEKNMYIAKGKTVYDINTYTILGYNTRIVKFKLNNGKIEYKNNATIQGKILNQFSMDEDSKENLRIAVTQDIQSKTENMIYILNSNLEKCGELTGLANGERIYSVRYMGNKGYIVTYKQVDPLFVIDLTDPQNPQKLGELKIPGYSTYLHPYDETHIIGLGYDTNTDGTRTQNNGLKLSMFDITDLNNPKEMFTKKIGNLYTYSDAINNHKAILYLKEKNIMAFPIQTYQNRNNISQALIYEIDLNQGFILKKQFNENTTNDYKKRIERIIFANGNYYLVSDKSITEINENTWQETEKVNID